MPPKAKGDAAKAKAKPKAKAAPARAKGQKSLNTFFPGGKKNASASDASDDEPVDLDSSDIPEDALPPIVKIPEIFADMVKRVPQLKGVAEQVQGRKIRVATMCSGTESPLLALGLIQQSILDQYKVKLELEHVFSCEIEPFKQAYIERNFHPPLLFRDVCELGQTHATTAYGALAPVPGDVDLLVAGTSCVDYSNLNNEKQDIEAQGESGRTFRGMLSWVTNHRPPLVILENVFGAPWDKVAAKFEAVGYSADYIKLDTKKYYIPHTRQRGYLLAVNKKNSDIAEDWVALLKKLQRPATSTIEEWLLPSDDPRIQFYRQKLVTEGKDSQRKTGRTDWGRCESRHQRARLEEALGQKRPLTNWEEGGLCSMPEDCWHDWGRTQVERVWDLLDISLLRAAFAGYDPAYKTQVWNLSQNVDRDIGMKKFGVCPCLTPAMIPYITSRGGPMVGLEALGLQGLPTDGLILSKETEDQLADLAGNAMSTTVVGTAIIAALVLGKELLRRGDDHDSYETKDKSHTKAARVAVDTNSMDIDLPAQESVVQDSTPIESHITGDKVLVERPLALTTEDDRSMAEFLAEAQRSVRLCQCEGRDGMTERSIWVCESCGSSACAKCRGRPEHKYPEEPLDTAKHPRLSPLAFAKELKAALPMSLRLSGIDQPLLGGLKGPNDEIAEQLWDGWKAAVVRTAQYELRFVELKRQEIWTVVYESAAARLELALLPAQPEWNLYAKPLVTEPAKSAVRTALDAPVARLLCQGGWLSGAWEFAIPRKTTVPVDIVGEGEQVLAWEAVLGLQSDEMREKKVYSRLRVSVQPEDVAKLDRDVSGVYDLLDKCGTACNALHKRRTPEDEADRLPVFLLFDPTRVGPWKEDSFAFTVSKRRYEFGESRPVLCRLDSDWRQTSVSEESSPVQCTVLHTWKPAAGVVLKPSAVTGAVVAVPNHALSVSAAPGACSSANAVLVVRVPLKGQAGPEWPRGEFWEVDKVHEREIFRSMAWLLDRVRDVGDQFREWQSCDALGGLCVCTQCAPTKPSIKWTMGKTKKINAIEDSIEAGEYERRLKHRPAPFVTQLRLDENEVGMVRIGVNVLSLMHRAFSRLPTEGRTEPATVSWRIDTNFIPAAKLSVGKYSLLSNRRDPEHAQPNFKISLRPEQLRSLGWMIAQEAADCEPFMEEEISEAVLEALGWRAEGRVRRPHRVRGGVLADEVGYGKTAITLGLIESMRESLEKEFKADKAKRQMKGKIAVKATLIVVPPHLTRQWKSEVKKFVKAKLNVAVIGMMNDLNKVTVEEMMEADIVIIASNIFHGANYLENLEAVAAAGDLPTSEGRYFEARLTEIHHSLQGQVDRLRDEGATAVLEEIRQGKRRAEEAAAAIMAPKKRLVGKAYREKPDPTAPETSKAAKSSPKDTDRKPSGMVMEVVIEKRSYSDSASATGPPTSAPPSSAGEEDSDAEDAPRRPSRRNAAKKVVIEISDDENADSGSDFEVPQAEAGGDGSDFDGGSAEESASEAGSEAEVESDDEVVKPKGKGKAKAKGKPAPKPKRKRAASPETSDAEDEAMDVDEPKKAKGKAAAKATKGRKRKSDDEGEDARPAKKKKERANTDPWKLKSKDVKENWQLMQCPPMEMFHFARKVVDEYTYLQGKTHSVITKITADRHWVLSGTPPVHDFSAVKTISAFLNIHLGIDEEGEGVSAQIKRRIKEQTAAEKFHSFREVHTVEWHANRYQLGQRFLNQYVRQNVAEIDEIPWTIHKELVVLPAAERAIYLELEHHLRALEMTIKRAKKSESDREKRLNQSLGESKTAEEALLKRCSHFELENANKENARQACDVIVAERTKQLNECKKDLAKHLKSALAMEKTIKGMTEESLFREHVRVCKDEGVGDSEATKIVVEIMQDEGISSGPLRSVTNKPGNAASTKAKAGKGKGKADDDMSAKDKERAWELREHAHNIRRVTKELVARVRSLRYFTVVRDLQKKIVPLSECPKCHRKDIPMDAVGVLSSCGHTGCLDCVTSSADHEECVCAGPLGCKAAARRLNIVVGDTLGVDDDARGKKTKHYGMKIEKVVDLIHNRIPKGERVLIFVQFPDLMKKVAEALGASKVKFLEIKGTQGVKSKNLETFQENGEERVLLLNVMDESASGANLTSANHAVFISPLLAESQEQYDACETQAIGRLRRFGQTKHVNIYRFLTTNTIDMEIYEQRCPKG